MDNREKEEEKNKRIGWLTSIGVQLVLLILFYFIIAWRAPFPPIPEYGIELGFISSSGATSSDSAPQSEEVVEEVIQESTEATDESVEEPVETSQPETEANQVTETVVAEESPIEVEETSEPEVLEEVPVEPEIDTRAIMNANTSDGDGQSESEGENEEVDERAIYGNQGANTGSSEGASLNLAGWMWDFEPNPDDSSDAVGKIEFQITVDENGEITNIKQTFSNVAPGVAQIYKSAVGKLTFSKTSDYKSAPLSTGTITFIIKSK